MVAAVGGISVRCLFWVLMVSAPTKQTVSSPVRSEVWDKLRTTQIAPVQDPVESMRRTEEFADLIQHDETGRNLKDYLENYLGEVSRNDEAGAHILMNAAGMRNRPLKSPTQIAAMTQECDALGPQQRKLVLDTIIDVTLIELKADQKKLTFGFIEKAV